MLLPTPPVYPSTASPKNAHLSEPTPAWAAAQPAVDAVFAPFWSSPDWPTFRERAGDAADVDAVIPPGGPDRSREVTTEKIQFAARDGFKVELKVYRGKNVRPGAVLMYRMHGGGWCVGRHEVDGAENVYAAARAGVVVVSVDYRKAPEYPFPTPVNDSYDGLVWCKNNADRLGINPEKIILAGGSAGANLATVLALEAKANNLTGILAQVLHFPSTCHPKLFPVDEYEFGSYAQNHNSPVLSIAMMQAFLDAYLPDLDRDHRHSPLLAESLKGLPPTLIQCAGADILRDDAFAYAEALRNAGVDVEFHVYKGVPHCFPEVLVDIPETAVFFSKYINFVRKITG